jgi:hypothetical protein
MNKKLISVMPACLLALILVFAACTNPAGDPPPYTAKWGAWDGANYSTISGNFSTGGVSFLSFPGISDAGYLTGTTATAAHTATVAYVAANPQTSGFTEDGEEGGSFEGLLNMPEGNGLSLPSGLKEALLAEEDNVPLAVLCQYTGGDGAGYGVLALYITKN